MNSVGSSEVSDQVDSESLLSQIDKLEVLEATELQDEQAFHAFRFSVDS
ncbi:MAG: hypothetical protein WCF25_06780 [Acidimicrobiales bacterium]